MRLKWFQRNELLLLISYSDLDASLILYSPNTSNMERE